MKKVYSLLAALLVTAATAWADGGKATINVANGTLTALNGSSSSFNATWTSASSDPTITLKSFHPNGSGANNMNARGDSLGLYSGQQRPSTYTIALPAGYVLTSYTVHGKAITANAQTVTPTGGTAKQFAQAEDSLKVAVGTGNTASFTLNGENTGLMAVIDVYYDKATSRTVTYNVYFNNKKVASASANAAIGSAAALPDELSVGAFATFTYSPTTISATTDSVTATLLWSPTAPVQFSDALDDNAKLYSLSISNNNSTYNFSYDKDASPNIATGEQVKNDNGLWAFLGNPYEAIVVNKGAGSGLQLASPSTVNAGNTGAAVRAVLTDNFTANPNHTWRIYPATLTNKNQALSGNRFYLQNKDGHRLNMRDGKLAYWTTGYDAGSAFTATAATTVASVGETVQGFRTTGRGVETWLTRTIVNAPTGNDGGTVTQLKARLKGNTAQLVSEVKLYAVNNDTADFYVLKHPAAYQVGETKTTGLDGELTFDFGDKAVSLSRGNELKLFLTATVKGDATLYQAVDAQVTSVTLDGNALAVSADPAGEAKIFKDWAPVFHWKNHGYNVWRIPAMCRAADNSLVAVIDATNDGFMQNGNWNPNPDPGYAPINVMYSRSEDDGKTWGKLDTLKLSSRAKGNNTYSFGDPSIAMTKSGKLIVMTCATDVNFWDGQKYPYMFTSTDNGKTFDQGHTINTRDILTDEVSNTQGFGGRSFFVTSGHGICVDNGKDHKGRVMFLINYITNSGALNNYVLYSDDEGDHWTIAAQPVWNSANGGSGNESKLVQRPDGKILASIRRNGPRGFNVSTDSLGLSWTGQYYNNEAGKGIHDAGVNADVIAYGDSMLIHTIINNGGSGRTRTDLEIFVSTDGGATWAKKFCVQQTYAGYSTMEVLPNGDLAILFEDGSYHYCDPSQDATAQYNTNIIHYYDITYLTIPRETIEQWGPVVGTLKPVFTTDPLATGISAFTASAQPRPADGSRYNLAGQLVGSAYKGIVIQNGKKMLVK